MAKLLQQLYPVLEVLTIHVFTHVPQFLPSGHIWFWN